MCLTNPIYTLGLDFSTQSLTAIVLDITSKKIIHEEKIPFLLWCDKYHLNSSSLTIKGLPEGKHEQPPLMFLRALDEVLEKITAASSDLLARVKSISVSAQQHGHLYLNSEYLSVCESLGEGSEMRLEEQFNSAFSYPYAPIWMTSNTTAETVAIREAVGGSRKLVELSGSDCPERFTGAVIKKIGEDSPEDYVRTKVIHLISSFLTSVLTAKPKVAIDYGNACGMSLMNYTSRSWDEDLLNSVADNLPEGVMGLKERLPNLLAPYNSVGRVAKYFSEKYGFVTDCIVTAGSGDNPQTKTTINGDLLSLGSSIVYMESQVSEGGRMDQMFNAMYDGLGRSFRFGCRTNGALSWDKARKLLEIDLDEQEVLLINAPIGRMELWQELSESFPPSKSIPLKSDFNKKDKLYYPALVDTTLLLMKVYGRNREASKPLDKLYLTGGPSESPAICQRLADLWQQQVVPIGTVGAGLGAAVCAYAGLVGVEEAEKISEAFHSGEKVYHPNLDKKEKVEELEKKIKDKFEAYLLV